MRDRRRQNYKKELKKTEQGTFYQDEGRRNTQKGSEKERKWETEERERERKRNNDGRRERLRRYRKRKG